MGEGVPAAESCGGDEEAGDGEKDLYAALTAPEKKGCELMREMFGVGHAGKHQTHVDVVH